MFGTSLDSNRQMLRSMTGWLGLPVIGVVVLSLVPPWHPWLFWLAGTLTGIEIGLLVWWPVRGRAADERRPPDSFGPRTRAELRGYRRIIAGIPVCIAPAILGLDQKDTRGLWLILLCVYLLLLGFAISMLVYRPRHPLPEIAGPVLPAATSWEREKKRLAWTLGVSVVVLAVSLGAWSQVPRPSEMWISAVCATVTLLAALSSTLAALLLTAGAPPEGLTSAEARLRLRPLTFAAATVPVSSVTWWLGWRIAWHSRENAAVGCGLLIIAGVVLAAGILLAVVGIRRARRLQQAAGASRS